jgi:hypothetical protein
MEYSRDMNKKKLNRSRKWKKNGDQQRKAIGMSKALKIEIKKWQISL